MKRNTGITLIALIVTIIILLILAGITITFMLGDNGILNRAKNAGMSYEEQAAREKLEIALADLGADKITDSTYNENDFIDDKLTKQDMIVNGDIVIVDGWQFEIDRSVPKIATNLGRGELNEQIQISATSVTSSDYTKATIQVKITYTGKIASITIKGETIAVPTPVNNVYTITKEIKENGKYVILVKDEEGNYQTTNIAITDITEDMDIWTKSDLENFRDKVNSGRTFAGRTVRVMADIDLQGSNTSLWVPIGNYASNKKLMFLGTFDGNDYKILNMYINSTQQYQGLFGFNKGTIKNIKVKNSQIRGTGIVGTICGYNHSGIIENSASEQNTITGSSSGVGGIVGANINRGHITKCYNTSTINSSYNEVGGIAGYNYGTISECYNKGTVQSNSPTIAGIAGGHYYKMLNCYNTGTIKSTTTVDAVGGIAGFVTVNQYTPTDVSKAIIQNCYNVGTISTTASRGGIVGTVQSSTVATTTNNYWLNTCGVNYGNSGWSLNNTGSTPKTAIEMKALTATLGNAFKQDTENINGGYPVLKWQNQ